MPTKAQLTDNTAEQMVTARKFLHRRVLPGLLAGEELEHSYNQKLKAFGVNVNFAPVCDVSTNPDNFI